MGISIKSSTSKKYSAVIIGSGPNGLAAGIELVRNGQKVLIVEAANTVGGGMRTHELTLPHFKHDFCSAVHPMGYLSPYFKQLPLEEYGLKWIFPKASIAHPLDNEEAVILSQSLEETANNLGIDKNAWIKLLTPFIHRAADLIEDVLKPLGIPKNPLLLARFGIKGMLPVTTLANCLFKDKRAKALLAGCAAHSVLPLDKFFTGAVGLLFAVTGHTVNWPIAEGGSQNIANALADYFKALGGEIQTGQKIRHFKELPEAKVYLFDTDPLQLATIAATELPPSYIQRLKKYRFGPGVFKIDYALDSPIPWRDPRCLDASTVHIGGTMEEIAISEKDAWNGKHTEKPFVLLTQQSQFDTQRAPEGKHTGWAYCHVPNGSTKDMTQAIEHQIERFAPGFKDIILAKHTTQTQAFHHYNPNYVGGAISGGATDMTQLFTRPVARWDPYSTPNPQLFICSASSPPGAGVHGMCGYYAAQSALKALLKQG